MKPSCFQLVFTLAVLLVLVPRLTARPVLSNPSTIIVPDDFPTIQGALYGAKAGDTIFVRNGTYCEHVIIGKSVTLVGEDRDATIIDGNGTGSVLVINANYVNVSNFMIRNAGRNWGYHPDSCILGDGIDHVNIDHNTFTNAAVCVAILHSSSGVNISNSIVSNSTLMGILDYDSHNVAICNNTLSDYGSEGIHLDGGSSYCVVKNNILRGPGFDGISLETNNHSYSNTRNNLVDGNVISGNIANLNIWGPCGTNFFRRNNMTDGEHNLVVWGTSLATFMQDIDDSNTVNDNVLCYLTNRSNLTIEPSNYPNLGGIALINCTNIMLRDFNLTSNEDGMLLAYSTNCTLSNMTFEGNRGRMIYGGLTFFESCNNTVEDCKIRNNSYGVCLYRSDWNLFYHNSFMSNDKNVFPDYYYPFHNESSGYFSTNSWDDGHEGNYWSDYDGTDSNGDGISDTSYTIDANNTDNYPLMSPYWYWSTPASYDLNHDMKTDMKDVALAAMCFGYRAGDPRWNPRADTTGDGILDIRDLVAISRHFGEDYR